MEVISNREEMIFRNERDGKVSYAIGLSKKKDDGTYERGFMPIKFRKGIELKDRTKIKIEEAWMDFFKIEKKTYPYIFINKFVFQTDFEAIKQVSDREIKPNDKTNFESSEDDNLPFY